MADSTTFTTVLNNAGSVAYLVGVVIAFGMTIQNMKILGHNFEKLERRFTDHELDREIHPSQDDINRRFRDIEHRRD